MNQILIGLLVAVALLTCVLIGTLLSVGSDIHRITPDFDIIAAAAGRK